MIKENVKFTFVVISVFLNKVRELNWTIDISINMRGVWNFEIIQIVDLPLEKKQWPGYKTVFPNVNERMKLVFTKF